MYLVNGLAGTVIRCGILKAQSRRPTPRCYRCPIFIGRLRHHRRYMRPGHPRRLGRSRRLIRFHMHPRSFGRPRRQESLGHHSYYMPPGCPRCLGGLRCLRSLRYLR